MFTRLKSFKYAIWGIIYCIKSQKNMQIHLLVAAMVIVLAFKLDITRNEFIKLSVTITLVLMAEMINTAIETVVDLITKEYHPLAKVAKDVAAGTVLIAAINAVIVGFLIIYGYKDEILNLF